MTGTDRVYNIHPEQWNVYHNVALCTERTVQSLLDKYIMTKAVIPKGPNLTFNTKLQLCHFHWHSPSSATRGPAFAFFFSFIDSSSWVLLSVNYKHVSNSDWHCEGPSALRCKDVRAHNSRHGFVRINYCFSLKKWTKTSHIEVEVLTNPALRGRLRARAAATRTDSMLVSYEVCPAPGEEREGWRTRQQIVERSPQPGSTSK